MSQNRNLVRAGTTVDTMVRTLADCIITGMLRPGERLEEGALAERFGVSRTPVREALRQLAAMGLVDRRPNRGAIVAVVSPEHLSSMFESMAELEALCARLAAERMTLVERRELDFRHQQSKRLVMLDAEDEYDAFNTTFHSAIYRGAHSSHIEELTLATRSRLAPFRRVQFRLQGRLARSWAEHDAIVTAVLRSDGAAAANATKAHVAVVSVASATFIAGALDRSAGPEPSSGKFLGISRR